MLETRPSVTRVERIKRKRSTKMQEQIEEIDRQLKMVEYESSVRKRFHSYTKTEDSDGLAFFTDEEQIERLARNLAFWMLESPNMGLSNPCPMFFAANARAMSRKIIDEYPDLKYRVHQRVNALIKISHKCEACGSVGAKFKKCARCEYVRYCSRDCQVQDWTKHKSRCNINK